MMRPTLRLLLLSLVACIASTVSDAAQNPDAADLDQAARLLAFQSRFNEELRVYCGKQFPETKSQFDILALAWIDANQAELNALQVYLPTVNRQEFDEKISASVAKSLSGLKNAKTPQDYMAVCEGFAERLNGAPPMANTTPKASRFLRSYLEAHPIPAIELQRSAARTVCLKKGMNQKLDLDALQPRCSCSTERIFQLLSPAELRELDAVVKAFGDIETLASVQRIQPQLAECQKR